MDTFMFDQKFHRLADFLGVDKYKRDNPDVAQKIAFISDWAEARSSDSFADILKTVVKLKRDLGTTVRGETLVKDLYKWTRLDSDSDRLDREKKAYKEYSSEKEKREAETKERIIEKRAKWEQGKQELEAKKAEVDLANEKASKSSARATKKQSKEFKKANTILQEEPYKDTSVEVAI